jgi:hypothetical protein
MLKFQTFLKLHNIDLSNLISRKIYVDLSFEIRDQRTNHKHAKNVRTVGNLSRITFPNQI